MSHKSKKKKAIKSMKRSGSISLAHPVSSGRKTAPFDPQEFERQFERRAARHEELRYRLAPYCKVHIQFNGNATQEAIRRLINYLEMGIGDFPEHADNSPL